MQNSHQNWFDNTPAWIGSAQDIDIGELHAKIGSTDTLQTTDTSDLNSIGARDIT